MTLSNTNERYVTLWVMEITQFNSLVVITQYWKKWPIKMLLISPPKSGKKIKPVKPNNNGTSQTNDFNIFLHITIFVINTADIVGPALCLESAGGNGNLCNRWNSLTIMRTWQLWCFDDADIHIPEHKAEEMKKPLTSPSVTSPPPLQLTINTGHVYWRFLNTPKNKQICNKW